MALRNLFIIVVITVLGLTLAGCGGGDKKNDARNHINKLKQQHAVTKAPDVQIAEVKPAKYQKTDRRNPFQDMTQTLISKRYPNAILGEYSITTFRLIGVLEQANHLWAVITTPDNKYHKITIGDRVGSQQALVTKISAKEVTLLNDAIAQQGTAPQTVYITTQKEKQ